MAGSVNHRAMELTLAYNYAVASTDTGHVAEETDASWAVGHPEKVKDNGWRATHETAVAAKALIAAYYGRPARHSYFSGGSNGGRQALMEAERFPEDYDGIVAGAPALDAANNLSTSAWVQYRLLRNPAGFIPDTKAKMITSAVLKACDGQDGVKDGIVDDPTVCAFDPASIACTGADAPDCLTPPQIAWLRDIYDGPGGAYKTVRNRGFERGGEAGWVPFWFSKSPEQNVGAVFSVTFFRDLVYGDRAWDISHMSFAHDRAAAAEGRLAPQFEADDPDLSRFAARGGKLILYQGWSDPFVPPRITIDYYERIRSVMGPASAGTFVRLYMVPGMGHVVGGPGPNVFGQQAPGGASDPKHSVNAAIEQWVERGIAPDAIVAGKYADDEKAQIKPGSSKPLRERPLCPYPQMARWTGTGSTDDAANFVCRATQP